MLLILTPCEEHNEVDNLVVLSYAGEERTFIRSKES